MVHHRVDCPHGNKSSISDSCPLNASSPLVVIFLMKHVPTNFELGLWQGFMPGVDPQAQLTPGAPSPATR